MSLPKETMEILETLAPELRRSEDERIRKEMIRYFTEMKKGGSAALPYDDCIAYLERQKERKSVEWNKATINGESIPTENQSVDIPLAKWGEEDEVYLQDALWCVKQAAKVTKDENGMGACWSAESWLESLPERFNLQSKQEWSKEDENKIERLAFLVSVAEEKEMISPSESIDLRNLIKSLRPQSKKELSIEKAIKWLDDTFYFLDNSSGRGRDCEITTHDFDSLEEMYDSFRKAVIVDSEPSWGPSEEQMEALRECGECKRCIKKLYEDLQKRYGTC